MLRPNFFVAGFPKSGTTSLCRWLAEHPKIMFPQIKEPHYFSKDLGNSRVPTLVRYEALFQTADKEHEIAGEGSTNYLYSEEAVKNILKYNPLSKFIICLRNPLELLPSLYLEYRTHLAEPAPSFETAWISRGADGTVNDLRFLTRDNLINYRAAGMLGYHCQRLLDLVPRHQVHFLLLDHMRTNPETEFRGILDFLDLEWSDLVVFEKYNEANQLRSPLLRKIQLLAGILKCKMGVDRNLGLFRPLRKFTYKAIVKTPLSKRLRCELGDVFEDDIQLLSSLTGYDLAQWRNNSNADEDDNGEK